MKGTLQFTIMPRLQFGRPGFGYRQKHYILSFLKFQTCFWTHSLTNLLLQSCIKIAKYDALWIILSDLLISVESTESNNSRSAFTLAASYSELQWATVSYILHCAKWYTVRKGLFSSWVWQKWEPCLLVVNLILQTHEGKLWEWSY